MPLHVVRLWKTSFQTVTKCNGNSVTLSDSHFELWGEIFSTGLPGRVVEGTNYYDNQCRSNDSFLPLDHAEMLQLIGSERSYNKDSLSHFLRVSCQINLQIMITTQPKRQYYNEPSAEKMPLKPTFQSFRISKNRMFLFKPPIKIACSYSNPG